MKTNSLKQIGEQLRNANSILIYPHNQMDGDALGSAVAMCRALRNIGKEAHVVIAEAIPVFLRFLNHDYCTTDQNCVETPDISLCIDGGEFNRFSDRQDAVSRGKITICLDHHATSKPMMDYNYIDPDAAATAEIVFQLIKIIDIPMDKEMGEAIYTGIVTDTGNFQYSNTTKQTHLIVAELFDLNIDTVKIAVEIYQNVSAEKIQITNRIMDTMEIFADGQAAIAYVTQKMIEEVGADMSDTEGVVENLRNIHGVEIAVFVKERSDKETKVSFRAKTWGNVMDIASKHDGGGHKKAAGCTFYMGVKEAIDILKDEVEKSLKQ